MKWNLTNRILLPSVALVMVATLVVCFTAFTNSRKALDTNIDAQVAELCEASVHQVERWVVGQRQTIVHWSGMAHVGAALTAGPAGESARRELTGEFADALKQYGCFQNFQLVDLNGNVVASSDPASVGSLNVADRSYFQDAAGGRAVISEVLKSRTTAQPIVVVAAPVYDGTVVRGVLFGSLDLEWFAGNVIDKIKVLQSGYAFLADDKGTVISHPDKSQILKLRLTDHEWGIRMRAMRSGQITYEFGNVQKRGYFQSSDVLGWLIVAAVPVAELNAPVYRVGWINLVCGLCVVVVAIAVMWFTVRSITGPILRVTDQLMAGADQTAAAAGQVSSSSQLLADGASAQAASLEETSASLEEVSSMTKSNADSAQQAKELSNQTRIAADTGTTDMEEMKRAMDGIRASSDGISKIIKTIDEIAFQTNILALNAAVEAARAGEAGMGFAVVAEEVRNLAQRSANSAKETAGKIEEAISRSETGVRISAQVAQSLGEIVEKARKVDALVAEIATASVEQTQGIGQVNTAVGQMDRVTQNNAASAEETAAAAEEMNSQSIVMHETIGELLALINGGHVAAKSGAVASPVAKQGKVLRAGRGRLQGSPPHREVPGHATRAG